MAQATLNPAIEGLNTSSALYNLYTKFYDGMTQANSVDAPSFVTDPIYKKNEDGTDALDEDGARIVDVEAMAKQMTEYSTILMKNSAYMLANAITTTIASSTQDGDGNSRYVARTGDTMQGSLEALYGFTAGTDNVKVFEMLMDADGYYCAEVTGNLVVSQDVGIRGSLTMPSGGILIGSEKTIWQDNFKLYFKAEGIGMTGAVSIDGALQIGDVNISKDGLKFGDYEFYHSGNSNKEDVDWTMHDANVARSLTVKGQSVFDDLMMMNGGFQASIDEQALLYTEGAGDSVHIALNGDLSIINSHGIKLNGNYIVAVRDNGNVVSFSSPGAVMNLGDSDTDSKNNTIATKYIGLQADIKNYNGTYTIITHDGNGNFPNGFSTGAANSLGASFYTYYNNSDDYGVVSANNMRFAVADGPRLYSDGSELDVELPYVYVDSDGQRQTSVEFNIVAQNAASLVYNPTGRQDMAEAAFYSDADYFSFKVPVESTTFAVKSSKYKTKLDENLLFFSDGVFLEGMNEGMRLSGNSLFDNNLYSFNPATSSVSFSSGFAGSGWAIMEDVTAGGIHATFDSLTIRKKMRVYELEVQKISVTNGSLWVSDSCSGDEVIALN